MLKTGNWILPGRDRLFIKEVKKDPTLKNIVAPHAYLHTIVFYDLIDRNSEKSQI